ncbi:hypothetical protein ABPG72_015540 [Tetrahymena utriculariae]
MFYIILQNQLQVKSDGIHIIKVFKSNPAPKYMIVHTLSPKSNSFNIKVTKNVRQHKSQTCNKQNNSCSKNTKYRLLNNVQIFTVYTIQSEKPQDFVIVDSKSDKSGLFLIKYQKT